MGNKMQLQDATARTQIQPRKQKSRAVAIVGSTRYRHRQ